MGIISTHADNGAIQPRGTTVRTGIGIVIVSTIAAGCAPQPSERAMRRLREVGQAVGEAKTFEASGHASPESGTEERVAIRNVFGPNGEYRIEAGDILAIHDTNRIASHVPETGRVHVGVHSSERPLDHYNRRHGDLPMASIMCTGGKGDYLLALMRVVGPEWLATKNATAPHLVPAPEATEIRREVWKGHRCAVIEVRNAGDPMRIWVDVAKPIMWKSELGEKPVCRIVEYEAVKMNHPVSESEFVIPQWMIEQDRDGQQSAAQESSQRRSAPEQLVP